MQDLVKSGLGVGFTLLFESQIFPFMLSSAFTARTIVKEKEQEHEVKQDVAIAMVISFAFTGIMAYFMHDALTAIVGTVAAFVIAFIYEWRGELL
ncbi:MAG: hypothetical protein QXL94_01055 [Candidatus Parvarchaeum sp.]